MRDGAALRIVGWAVLLALGCSGASCGITNPPEVSPSLSTSPSPTTEPPPTADLTSDQQAPCIVLYKNVVAGDYGVLRILSSGQAEFTGYNGMNHILEHRQGDLGAEGVTRLFRLLEERGFFELEGEYDIYPQDPGDTKVYEDIYYWLKVSVEDRPERTVVAHEKARPPNLAEITTALLDVAGQLPESPVRGTFIIAGDAEILHHKRPVEGEPVLQLDDESVQQYPLLEQALRNPFSLVEGGALEDSRLGEVLTADTGSVEVIFAGKRFAVLLLKGED